jgi:hypothetical protein
MQHALLTELQVHGRVTQRCIRIHTYCGVWPRLYVVHLMACGIRNHSIHNFSWAVMRCAHDRKPSGTLNYIKSPQALRPVSSLKPSPLLAITCFQLNRSTSKVSDTLA